MNKYNYEYLHLGPIHCVQIGTQGSVPGENMAEV
jgi:hypothetical protein